MGDLVTPELFLSQIEIGTPVCRTLAEVRGELQNLRREDRRRREGGSRIAAAGLPYSHWGEQKLTPKSAT